MLHYWFLLSWCGSASLQFVDPAPEPLDHSGHVSLPYLSYLNLPLQDFNLQHDAESNTETYNQFYQREDLMAPERKRRMIDNNSNQHQNWLPNLLDTDQTLYMKNEEKPTATPFIVETYSEENTTSPEEVQPNMKKRSFSPWGGKRSKPIAENLEQMWSWKRAAAREPSMPKRVRFSPWGGKRSGQIIYKPGSKAAKVFYPTSIPDFARIANYPLDGEHIGIARFPLGSILEKRSPVRILTLNTEPEHVRDALPFKMFLDSLPGIFKPGHPYLTVNLKKDGKRKVKFSTWGGKRSPPIIGPIWTPAPNNVKEPSLGAIILIRNAEDKDGTATAQ